MNATDKTTPELALDFAEREVVLRAGFDEVDDEGGLWVSFRFLRGPRPPRVGETIYLVEPGGRGCLARVQSVNGWVARVMPETPPRR